MLMVLGLAMLLGGWKHKELRFNRMAAETGSSMMLLAVVALVIPAIYATVTQHREPQHIESISLDISYILILTYVASLVFQLKTHQRFFSPEPEGETSRTRREDRSAWTGERGARPRVDKRQSSAGLVAGRRRRRVRR